MNRVRGTEPIASGSENFWSLSPDITRVAAGTVAPSACMKATPATVRHKLATTPLQPTLRKFCTVRPRWLTANTREKVMHRARER